MNAANGRPRECDCGECRNCRKRNYNRERYQRLTLEERRAIIANRDPENVKASEAARYLRNRDRLQEKRRARWTLNNAVRDGRVIREPCEICGAVAQAHHSDYTKPLEVKWLCHRHHSSLHTFTRRLVGVFCEYVTEREKDAAFMPEHEGQ